MIGARRFDLVKSVDWGCWRAAVPEELGEAEMVGFDEADDCVGVLDERLTVEDATIGV